MVQQIGSQRHKNFLVMILTSLMLIVLLCVAYGFIKGDIKEVKDVIKLQGEELTSSLTSVKTDIDTVQKTYDESVSLDLSAINESIASLSARLSTVEGDTTVEELQNYVNELHSYLNNQGTDLSHLEDRVQTLEDLVSKLMGTDLVVVQSQVDALKAELLELQTKAEKLEADLLALTALELGHYNDIINLIGKPDGSTAGSVYETIVNMGIDTDNKLTDLKDSITNATDGLIGKADGTTAGSVYEAIINNNTAINNLLSSEVTNINTTIGSSDGSTAGSVYETIIKNNNDINDLLMSYVNSINNTIGKPDGSTAGSVYETIVNMGIDTDNKLKSIRKYVGYDEAKMASLGSNFLNLQAQINALYTMIGGTGDIANAGDANSYVTTTELSKWTNFYNKYNKMMSDLYDGYNAQGILYVTDWDSSTGTLYIDSKKNTD